MTDPPPPVVRPSRPLRPLCLKINTGPLTKQLVLDITPLYTRVFELVRGPLTYVATHVDTKINLMQVSEERSFRGPQQMECAMLKNL